MPTSRVTTARRPRWRSALSSTPDVIGPSPLRSNFGRLHADFPGAGRQVRRCSAREPLSIQAGRCCRQPRQRQLRYQAPMAPWYCTVSLVVVHLHPADPGHIRAWTHVIRLAPRPCPLVIHTNGQGSTMGTRSPFDWSTYRPRPLGTHAASHTQGKHRPKTRGGPVNGQQRAEGPVLLHNRWMPGVRIIFPVGRDNPAAGTLRAKHVSRTLLPRLTRPPRP